MQRVVATGREVTVDRDEVLHSAHFRGENDPVAGQADFDGSLRVLERRQGDGSPHDLLGCQGLRAGRVLVHESRQELLVEAAPVHADAHGLVVATGGLDHFSELRIALAATADVTGVDTVLREGFGAGRVLTQELVAVEVEVADEGHVDALFIETLPDEGHAGGGLARVDCDAHELGACAGEGFDLLGRAFDIRGVRVRHRLHDDGGVAADTDGADGDLERGAAGGELGCGLSHRHKEGVTCDAPILQGEALCCWDGRATGPEPPALRGGVPAELV